jgi:hypothetical protein
MQEVETMKSVEVAWISNYYLNQNNTTLIVFSCTRHNYARG